MNVALVTATPSSSSNIALRYTTGVQAPPATERHTASARPGQPATTDLTRNCSASAVDTSAVVIAASQAAIPSLAPRPFAVRRVSTFVACHATTSAYHDSISAFV